MNRPIWEGGGSLAIAADDRELAGPSSLSQFTLDTMDRHRVLFLGLVVLAQFLAFNGIWHPGMPDSALYLCVGRNLATGQGYTYLGQPQRLVYPGLPYALAGIFRVFGGHALFAANFMIMLCGLAVLGFTYRLVLLAYDRPTAVVITAGLGMSYEFFRYCQEIMTDVPFLMGVMAFLAGYEAIFGRPRRWRWWDVGILGFGLFVVVVTRPTMIGLVSSAILATVFVAIRYRPMRWVSVGLVAATVAAILLFLWLDPRRSGGGVGEYEKLAMGVLTGNAGHPVMEDIKSHFQDLLGSDAARALVGAPLGFWWLNFIVSAVALGAGLALIVKRPIWGLWIATTIAMLVLMVSHDRYFIEILPLICLGWWQMLRKINVSLPRPWGDVVFGILLALGTVVNIGQVAATIVHQHRQPFLAHYKDGRLVPYQKIAPEVAKFAGPDQWVLCPRKMATILSFMSDRKCVNDEDGSTPDPLPLGAVWVVIDPGDTQMQAWLASLNVTLVGQPVATTPNISNGNGLSLIRGNVQFH